MIGMYTHLIDELKSSIKGRVLTDMLDRYMYASDASAYEILPLCIVIARDVQDVVNAVKIAYEHRVPVTARGGGSGLTGQAIGSGIIIDLTAMNRLLDLDLVNGHVTVEVGMYKGVLDRELKKHGKLIPVDPSSSDYCTIGGMIANNSSGAHTVKYGSMIDYVEELDVVLADGSMIHAGKVGLNSKDDSMEAKLARELYSILAPNIGIIRERFPRVSKNSSGYRIDRVLLDDHTVDLAKVFVASEGTLGIVVRAMLKIIDMPRFKALALLAFDDTYNASLYVRDVVIRLGPSAVELIDRTVIDMARMIYSSFGFGYGYEYDCMLFVEFDGSNMDDVRCIMDKLLRISRNAKGLRHVACSYDEDEISRLWEVRKRALAHTMKVRMGKSRPIAFIEDPVVSVDRLPDLVDALRSIYRRYGIPYSLYGHAGDGNLHTRPILDLSNDHGLEIMKALAYEVFKMVKGMNGSISAEHGDGLARSEFVRMLYGDEIYSLFVKVKSIFDARGIMNPNKKVTSDNLLVKNLRYSKSVDYDDNNMLIWGSRSSTMARRITGYDEELAYSDEVALCHGCGMCRELNYKVRMCPVYKGLQDEVASCRGRNNVLRWLLNIASAVEHDSLMDSKYEELIYKYCIQCKMCLIDCPSNVNVGKIMAEARARYAMKNGLPKGYRYFADIDRYARLACRYSWLSNMLISNRMFRLILEHIAGIDARKRIPRFSTNIFDELFHEYKQPALDKSVAFFADTYIRYINPMLGLKIVKILNINGYRVEFPEQLSSGLPALLEGAIDTARRTVEFNIASLYPYASKGIPIVTFSPSASLALRMEYLNVLDDERSRAVADNVQDVHEFLYNLKSRAELAEFKPVDEDILVHMHCHTLVQGYDKHVVPLLKCIPSLRLSILEKGCCGVGGSYSFIKGNYDLSILIGRELFNAVKASSKRVYTTGESCRLQIEEGSGKDLGLTIELIARAYNIK
ncbi:MAG: FAD-linked oxidase C-terminal domain-containing protein [Candidatus Nitrosocaldus sp.]